MLLKESEEWLKVGDYNSPMGQYLEELSKRNVPKRLKSLDGRSGSRAGFIDVRNQSHSFLKTTNEANMNL